MNERNKAIYIEKQELKKNKKTLNWNLFNQNNFSKTLINTWGKRAKFVKYSVVCLSGSWSPNSATRNVFK